MRRLFNSWSSPKKQVRAIFRGLLGRDPDPEALAAYSAQISDHGLCHVLKDVCRSEEFWERMIREHASDLVKAAFRGLLRREPEPDALAVHVEGLAATRDISAIFQDVFSSQEFREKVMITIAPDLVRAAYRGLLGRDPDPDGLATHSRAIAESKEFTPVLANIVRSNEFMCRMNPLYELKDALSKIDKSCPVYGFAHLSGNDQASREWAVLCQSLEQIFKREIPNFRILDVGCSAGFRTFFFSECGATVTGMESRREYIEFCRILAGALRINARFEFAEFDGDYCSVLPEGRFDMAFVFGVLENLAASLGADAAKTMMDTLLDKTDAILFETAANGKDACSDSKSDLPAVVSEIFSGIEDIRLGKIREYCYTGSEASKISIYLAKKTKKIFNGIIHNDFAVQSAPVKAGTARKFYITEDHFTKCFIFVAGQQETYSQFVSEVETYSRIGPNQNFLELLGWEIRGDMGLVTLPRIRGKNLAEAILAGEVSEMRPIVTDITRILDSMHRVGLFWNDFGSHNLFLTEEKMLAIDFETASPVERVNTLNAFLWTLFDLQSQKLVSIEEMVFEDPAVPRPAWEASDFAGEIRDFAEMALGSRNLADFLRQAGQLCGGADFGTTPQENACRYLRAPRCYEKSGLPGAIGMPDNVFALNAWKDRAQNATKQTA